MSMDKKRGPLGLPVSGVFIAILVLLAIGAFYFLR
jgi:hypothetical protein